MYSNRSPVFSLDHDFKKRTQESAATCKGDLFISFIVHSFAVQTYASTGTDAAAVRGAVRATTVVLPRSECTLGPVHEYRAEGQRLTHTQALDLTRGRAAAVADAT